jgi:hypothetical protein
MLPLRMLVTGGSGFLLLCRLSNGDTASLYVLPEAVNSEILRSMAGSARVEDEEPVRSCGSLGSLRTAAAAESRVETLVSNLSLR